MTAQNPENLYHLLPVIYRQLDIERGEPLRALMDIIESEYRLIEHDIDGLYGNWFIETCDEWVVPYIADLISVRGSTVEKNFTATLRGRVANTIAYRRRKGIASTLEHVTQDVTGWKAHVVEFFKQLSITQSMRGVRLDRGRTVKVRDRQAVNDADAPFNSLVSTIDVRSRHIDPAEQLQGEDLRQTASLQGKYNIGNVGLFLWRLQSYPMTRCIPKQIQPLCYSFHPLGDEWQPVGLELFTLFNQPLTESSRSQASRERNVPAALRRRTLAAELAAIRRSETPPINYFGTQPVLQIFTKNNASSPCFENIPPANIAVRDLRDCRGRLLFSMAAQFANLLNFNGKLHYEIRHLFEEQKVWLTQDTTVIVHAWDSQWLIIEGYKDQSGAWRKRAYVLTKAGDRIEVYDQSLFVLFRMPLEDVAHLEEGQIKREVRNKFSEHGISLLADDQVAIEQPFWRWSISDVGGKEQKYIIVREDSELDVYDPAINVAVDPVLGRLAFPSFAAPDEVRVSYSYGFSADIGGGAYDRQQTQTIVEDKTWRALVSIDKPVVPLHRGAHWYDNLKEALEHWRGSGRSGLIQIGDNGIYELGTTDPAGALTGFQSIEIADGKRLAIEAANGVAPYVRGGLILTGRGKGASVKLNGLWMEGVILLEGELQLDILHCTLKPQARGLLPGTNLPFVSDMPVGHGLVINIERSIVGRISLPGHTHRLSIQDSIVDGGTASAISGDFGEGPACLLAAPGTFDEFGPLASLARSTIFGQVSVKELTDASSVIFRDTVNVHNRQSGSVRYCYVPPGSKTPQRYRCQPDLALRVREHSTVSDGAHGRLRPTFTSEVYGHPGYAQLGLQCPPEIRSGAEDGSEMGVFSLLYQPQRRTELRYALAEYLPFGQEAGIFYVN